MSRLYLHFNTWLYFAIQPARLHSVLPLVTGHHYTIPHQYIAVILNICNAHIFYHNLGISVTVVQQQQIISHRRQGFLSRKSKGSIGKWRWMIIIGSWTRTEWCTKVLRNAHLWDMEKYDSIFNGFQNIPLIVLKHIKPSRTRPEAYKVCSFIELVGSASCALLEA